MNYCRTECIMDGILSRRWIQTGWLSGLRRRAEVVKSCRVDELDTEVQGRGERCVQCDRLSLFNFDNNYLIKMDFFFWHSQPNGFLTFPSFSSSIMRKLFRYVSYFNYSWILKCILPYNLNSSRSDSLPSLVAKEMTCSANFNLNKKLFPHSWCDRYMSWSEDTLNWWLQMFQDGILGRNQQQKQGSGFKKTTFICILFRGSFTSLSDPVMVSLSYLWFGVCLAL